MKKVLLTVFLIPVVLLLLLLIFLSVKYSPVYVYRLITQNVPDIYDYKLYANRTLKPSNDTFEFELSPNPQYVEMLFSDRIKASGCKTLDEWAIKSKSTALIFVRNDSILYEKYFNGFNRDSYFHSQSMAKSFISFMIGAAIDDGLIENVDDPLTKYIPELMQRDSGFGHITIRHLLQMRSGLQYNTSYIPGTHIHAPWHDEAVGYYHPDVRKLLLEKIQTERMPGVTFEYCNYNTSYLGLIIEKVTKQTVSSYLEKKLWSKIMAYDALFSIDSEETGFEYMPSRLIARAIDYARFGRLYLKKGNWNDQRILSENWVVNSTREDKSIDLNSYPEWFGRSCKHAYYGWQWWGHMDCDSTFQFTASGNLGQNIYIVPDLNIVMVHCGNSLEHYGDLDLWQVIDNIQ